jgi:DNA-binding transcriptional ArsR family regulator
MTILQYGVNMSSQYQKQISKNNERKIINLLTQSPRNEPPYNRSPYGLTFTELIQKSGLSRGVVNLHLRKLEAAGMIKKEYSKGKILNVLLPREKLSPEGKKIAEPVLFGHDALPYVLAEQIYFKDLSSFAPGLQYFEIKKEKNDLKANLELIGKRLGVFYLFAFVKTFEENNLDWLKEAGNLLEINAPYVFLAFNQSFSHDVRYKQASMLSSFTKEDVAKLKNMLKQIYSEEFKEFEDILRGQRNYEHPMPSDS